MNELRPQYLTAEHYADASRAIWVEPTGGQGDLVMLSTALKEAFDRYGRRFMVVERTAYTPLLGVHPAVEGIGHPGKDDLIVRNDYWARPEYGTGEMTSLNIVRKIFGVEAGESGRNGDLYLPTACDPELTGLLLEALPTGRPRVILSRESDSPRKVTSMAIWNEIATRLREAGCEVIQTGTGREPHIEGTTCLLGVTTAQQLPEILATADAVVTPDSYAMHAAEARGVECVALFGPTSARAYSYAHTHVVEGDMSGCPQREHCIGPDSPDNYGTPCPLGTENHCMNKIDVDAIVSAVIEIVNKAK